VIVAEQWASYPEHASERVHATAESRTVFTQRKLAIRVV